MNATTIKLLLALLWLVPGFGFLALDLVTGERHGVHVFGRDVPYAWIAIPIGLINLVRWYAGRPPRVEPSSLHRRHDERRRTAPPSSEPDSNFRFGDPPRT